jgi:hypothetical protein
MNIVTSFFAVRRLAQAMNLATSELPPALDVAAAMSADQMRRLLAAMPEPVRRRQEEYAVCVLRNVECPHVKRVLLVVQDAVSFALLRESVVPRIPQSLATKLVPVQFAKAPQQPHYADLFRASRMLADPNTPTMVCNSDIYLTTSFNIARVQELFAPGQHPQQPAAAASNVALALTRYEDEQLSAPLIADYRGSHDAFIVRPRDLTEDFLGAVDHPQNCYKAENIVLHELQRRGFEVRNPCLSVHIFHQHGEDVRQWLPPVDEERYGRAYPES